MFNNKPLWILAAIFFVVGAMFCMNDVIFPYAKEYYGLSYFQATLIQWTFYLVYLPFPFIISNFLEKYGYKWVVIVALLICIMGCLIFFPSYLLSSFGLLLASIFVLSTGITFLNVGANPFAALLGPPDQSQLRINFVQVFSRIGYAVTPMLGNALVKPSSDDSAPTIYLPYLFLAGLFIAILVIIPFAKMPSMKPQGQEKLSFKLIVLKALKIRHLKWGALAMFFYVGAEACTASFFISYFSELDFSIDQASVYLTWYNVAAGIAGFAGIYILKFVAADRLVATFSIILILLFVAISVEPALFNPFGLIAIGAFMAIMFPTIYGLAIEGLGDFTGHGAALVSLAIFGGAVFPPIQGLIADQFGVINSYFIPGFCFVFILIYSLSFSKPHKSNLNA